MKAIETFGKVIIMLLAFGLMGCEKGPEELPLRRDTDAVELTYNAGATNSVTVRYNGHWSTRIECLDEAGNPIEDWFTVTPSEGNGDGNEYQWVEITAGRNAGDRRTGTLYLISGEGEYAITVSQADGHFSVEDPVVTGTLKSGNASSAALTITYDKAFGGEEISVATAMSGATAGLAIEEEYTTTIETEGSGSIVIPITGTPENLGELVLSVTFTMDSEEIFKGDIPASIASSNMIFEMGFDSFVWGGNYPANQPGPSPNGSSTAGKAFLGSEPATGQVTAGTDGTNDVFSTMTEEYRINRGVQDWSGLRVYEHPGYLKLGVTANGGRLITPELTNLSSAPQQVVVSIDFLRFDNEEGTYLVTAEGAGTVVGGVVNSILVPTQSSASGRKWTTVSFVVNDATNQTRIKIEAEQMGLTGYRINVDNIRVMGPEEVEVTEQLPAVDVKTITFIPTENSLTMNWTGIEGATGYEVSIATEENPDFKKTITTASSTCEFTGLAGGYYIFTVKALYERDAAFNSEEVTMRVGTAGYAVAKLDAPTDVTVSDVLSTSATVSWTGVPGGYYYQVSVATASDSATEIAGGVVTSTSYEITGLSPATEYIVTVTARASETTVDAANDSDPVTTGFTTADPQPLTKPTLTLYHKSHALAVVQFGFDSSQQEDTRFGITLYDSDGSTVLREYSFNFSAGNQNKYSRHGLRFLFADLDASHTYYASIKRNPVDASLWLESEWSEPLAITTDAAPDRSGYLVWNDFDNHPWGGNGPMVAFGMYKSSGQSSMQIIDWESLPASTWSIATPAINMNNLLTGVGASGAQRQAYHNTYMSDWGTELLSQSSSANGVSTVYLCGGMMKFGTGSSAGTLTMPPFSSLTGETNIEMTFNAAPYVEPDPDNGSLEDPHEDNGVPRYDGLTFNVEITSGPGTIVTADGASVGATAVQLTNNGIEGANSVGRYTYTPHTVIFSGVTADTRIAIKTVNSTGNRRMWLDDLKVKAQ